MVVLVDLVRLVLSKYGCGLSKGAMNDEELHVKFRAEVDGVEASCVEVG